MAGGAVAQERVMIVLDGSGSMWGQIDGVPKLTIARQVLHDVLPTVPETTELGLVAYGHREKGNCADIELVVPPAQGTAAAIADAADNMKFLGKTPLSEAVKFAAEQLRYTEDKATVVLITDGIETCEADPCALGKALEEQGIDFTAHVVGFGLSEEEGAQVACLAENTGGLYLQADDPDELTAALEETVVAAPTPSFSFEAVDQDDVAVKGIPLNWTLRDAGGAVVASQDGAESFSATLEEGSYSISVEGPGISGGTAFDISSDSDGPIMVPVEVIKLTATLQAPDQVEQGSQFEVTWDGPNGRADFVTIVEADEGPNGYINYAYTDAGNPAIVTAPAELGTYELRYVHNDTNSVLARQPIEVVEAVAALKAPKELNEGQEFEVNWQGPDNARDYVTIVAVGADEGTYGSYFYTGNGNPGTLVAPETAGDYEIRYVLDEGSKTLVSIPVKVLPVSATLTAPASVQAGGEFEVAWTGPNNPRDYVTIVEVGADQGSYGSYGYTSNENPVVLTAPDGLGTFEIRYVMGQSNRTLATTTIELTGISAKVSTDDVPVPGSSIYVDWSGPDNNRDYITLIESGAPDGDYGTYAYTRNGNPAEIRVPKALGSFEIRYVLGEGGRVLARIPVTIAPAAAELSAPASVGAGEVIEVAFKGPGNRNDVIDIVPAGSNDGRNGFVSARTSQGSPVQMFAPDRPGEYEVRYKAEDGDVVLARVPLTVN
ncbi:MAG: VWA domain-containing protein [Hyphomicrobiaceae bacterium]|nr:VWA domain-containing protein [Hyphomicrobiaceae bacterium]